MLTTIGYAAAPLPVPNFFVDKVQQSLRSKPINLPDPSHSAAKPQKLTIKDAILLALRNNPDIRNAELDRITQKFALAIAHNKFEPQYSLSGTATLEPGSLPSYGVTPKVTLKTPLGTEVSTTFDNNFGGGNESAATISVTQPLLKGLGPDVTLAALHDAETTELINKLSLKSTLMSTITTIINDYYDLVEAYQQYDVQKKQLKTAEKQLKNSRLKAKVGKLAPAELTQQLSSVSSQKLSLTTQANSIEETYQNLLKDLGLNPEAKLTIDTKTNYQGYKIPSVEHAVNIALANDPSYQTDLLTIKNDRRAVLTAKDALKPTLDLTASETHVLGASGNFRGTGGAISNSENPGNRSVSLKLSVPLNDKSLEEGVLSARIDLEKQKIKIAQDKRNLTTKVVNDINKLKSQKKQIKLAQQTVKYSRENYQNDILRYRYGKIDSFQLITDQQTLISDEQDLITQQIDFITQFAQFQQDIGITLKHWGIKVKY